MFKFLVKLITEIKDEESLNIVCGEIDRAYQSEKISFAENELLYKLIQKVNKY